MLQIFENVPELVIGRQSQYAYRAVIAPHMHNRAQLLYPSEGAIRVHTQKHVWIVSAQSALWIPAGIEHSVVALSQVQLSTALVETEVTSSLGTECLFIQMTGLLSALILRINQVERAHPNQGANTLELIKAIQTLILNEIHQAAALPLELPWPNDARLISICESLLSTPQQTKNLDAWADQIGTSARTLMRLFQKQTGLTYRAWIQQMHIALAMEKLAQGESVARVADALGYHSPSAFSAMFKRHLGQAPQQFMKK